VTHALLWDIDGTLLSTARAGVFALEQAAEDVCGAPVDLQEMPTAGMTDGEIAAAVLRASGADDGNESVARFLRAYERHLPDRLGRRRGSVLPGVVQVLEHFHERPGVITLLLTGNTPAGAEAKLGHYGLDRFFDGGVFCVDLEDRASIARRAVEVARERAGEPLDPDAMFVIGDTPADVRCGRSIGARTVAVASGSHSAEELAGCEPWLVLDELPAPERFAELLGIS
jgi:phosphoglycolate phosphatase-like HAD superfamily hydrolase